MDSRIGGPTSTATPPTTAKTAGDQRRSRHTMLEQDRGECAPTSGSDATAPVTSRVGKPQHNYAFTALFVLLWRYIRIRCQRSPGNPSRRGRTSNVRRITQSRNLTANCHVSLPRHCEFDAAPSQPTADDGA